MAKRVGMVKVEFRDRHNNSETLWATPLGRHRYRLENCPFFAYGVSWRDVVEARPPAKRELPLFVRVTKKSGHRTVRVILKPPADKSRKSAGVLKKTGADGLLLRRRRSCVHRDRHPPEGQTDERRRVSHRQRSGMGAR
jgi:Domain of unknown function (DUF4265)